MTKLQNPIGYVVESSPGRIIVEIADVEKFETNKRGLSIGQYLLIASGNTEYVLAVIMSLRVTSGRNNEKESALCFEVELQSVGTWDPEGGFERGAFNLPVPTESAFIAPAEILSEIFGESDETGFAFGHLSVAPAVPLHMNGNRLFNRHLAIVGSTGSGKSCAVACIIHKVIGLQSRKNLYRGAQKNSHIVIFDIHSEYSSAFRLDKHEDFTLNELNVENLMLPYWLMNAEELEEIFVESNETNSHNQISQFRQAVISNKVKHNPGIADISFDLPIYFSIEEVCNYLENMNNEVIGKLSGEGVPKLIDNTLVRNRVDCYFEKVHEFVVGSSAAAAKASNGPFHGEFDRLVLRLRTRLADPRLSFLFYPRRASGAELKTDDFEDVLRQFIGYINQANVSIVDLSGILFEVLNIVVSLVSRMIFDFGFHYSKLRHSVDGINDVPIMIVCEEAHNYIPRSGGTEYKTCRKSIERIAKEGRKYGVTLMVVSQRPSEVSETIFSQCSNFIALRLTNAADQAYVKALLPDLSLGVGDLLPNLLQGEFLAVGDAMIMPSIGKFVVTDPEPQSRSVQYLEEWRADWRSVDFDSVVARWRYRGK